jgi:hypothetical protein
MEGDREGLLAVRKMAGFSEDDMACSKATGVWWGWSFGFESFDGFVLKRCFKSGRRRGFLEFWHPARELDSTFQKTPSLSQAVCRMAWKSRPNRVEHVTMNCEFTTWLAVPKSSKKRPRQGWSRWILAGVHLGIASRIWRR